MSFKSTKIKSKKRVVFLILLAVITMIMIQPLLGCCEQCTSCTSCDGCSNCGSCTSCSSCEGCGCDSCGCSSDSEDDGADAAEDNTVVTSTPVSQETPPCSPTMEQPNGSDDDCDGSIDEENCGDNIDNNGNGQADESPPC